MESTARTRDRKAQRRKTADSEVIPSQSACTTPEPGAEHKWLTSLAGEWTFETECVMAPGGEPTKGRGTETVRLMGDLWAVFEGRCEMPGMGQGTTLMVLGYDPAKKLFVGSWAGSMMTHLWQYAGTRDAAGILTLDTEGPSFSGDGKLVPYQDIHEIKSAEHRVLSSRVLGDGKSHLFMTAHYRRK